MEYSISFDAKKVQRALTAVPKELDASMHRAAIIASAVVSDAAKVIVDSEAHNTGALGRSLVANPPEGNFSAGTLVVDITAGGGKVTYARHVEYGTKAHIITPRYKPRLWWATPEGWVTAMRVEHPGTKAVHYMKRAVEKSKAEVTEVIVEGLTAGFRKAGF